MNKNQNREGNAFIGLDIDLQDGKPAAARSSSTQLRKRSRPRSTPTAAKRPRRPPPTPAPPAALVSLIQGDGAVLNYFKSLQSNLDYDVDKWKAEAQRWKKIAQDKQSKSPSSLRVKSERSLNNNASRSMKKHKDDDSNNIPITDEALFGGSDDSDDQSNCNTEMHTNIKVEQGHISDNKRATIFLDELKEAKQCLDSLGVSLVEVEVKTTMKSAVELADNSAIQGRSENDNDCGKSTDTVPNDNLRKIQTTTIERILHRQSDEKVAGEMMASLKTLIKTYSCITGSYVSTSKHIDDEALDDGTEQNMNKRMKDDKTASDTKIVWNQMMQYHPFFQSGKVHMPTVYMPNQNASLQDDGSGILPAHPAAIGLNHVIKILTIMGMYCNDALSDSEWDALFEHEMGAVDPSDEELLLVLKVGMRNRCRIANRVMSTLSVEITRNWALVDRMSYLTVPSLLFHASDTIDGNEPEPTKVYPPKLYGRLVSLEERIAHARIATALYRQRDDWQKAAELVLGYVLSCAPSIGVEDYPKLPPALSLCVLEALLSQSHCALDYQKSNVKDGVEGWFPQYIHLLLSGGDNLESKTEKVALLLETIAYPIHTALSIWKERSFCSDPRIRDLAMIELAAFQRIRQSADAKWIDKIHVDRFDADVIIKVCNNALDSAKDLLIAKTNYLDNAVSGIVCALSLLTLGDIDKVLSLCEEGMISLGDHSSEEDGKASQHTANISIMPLCCSIYVSLMIRKWDALKLRNGEGSGRHTAAAFTMVDRFSPILQSLINLMNPTDWRGVDTLLRCCVLMGDGRSLLQIANDALPSLMKATHTLGSDQFNQMSASRTMTTFVDVGELPTVRVINLKRRPDRLLDFMSNASREQVIVIKGPSAVKQQCNEPEEYAGHYAFDGNCTLDELKTQLGSEISDYVTVNWRPGDLRAFDRKARKTNDLVRTSMTEKCCAISHIATWIGVKRSLSEFNESNCAEG